MKKLILASLIGLLSFGAYSQTTYFTYAAGTYDNKYFGSHLVVVDSVKIKTVITINKGFYSIIMGESAPMQGVVTNKDIVDQSIVYTFDNECALVVNNKAILLRYFDASKKTFFIFYR